MTDRIILSFLLLVSFTACKHIRPQERYEVLPVEVEVEVLQSDAGQNRRTYVGEIESGKQVNASFAYGGKLTYLGVKNGDKVRQGDVIARIDDQQQRNAVRTAKAQLDQAKDGYARMKKVWEQGAVAEVKWVEMQTKLEQAQSVYDLAQKNLADCVLHSPMAGQIDLLKVSAGQQLAPGQPLCSIVALDDVSVHFSVPENEVSRIRKGQEAQVTVPALGEEEMNGVITETGLTANRLAHSYEVTVVLRGKSDKRLLPGMVCKVLVAEEGNECVVVPAACVQTRPEGQSVWVIENGIAVRRAITAGGFVQNGVSVSEGLQAGDSLVVKGYQKLYTGAEIKIKP